MAKNKLKKELKKAHKKHSGLIFIFLLLGIGAGFGTTYYLTRNDVFELKGNTQVNVEVGGEYIEEYANIIAFGKDISGNVKIEGVVDTTKEGRYVLKYTVDNIRYKGYTLYRLVIVGGGE